MDAARGAIPAKAVLNGTYQAAMPMSIHITLSVHASCLCPVITVPFNVQCSRGPVSLIALLT